MSCKVSNIYPNKSDIFLSQYDHATGYYSTGGMAYDGVEERIRFVSRDEENHTESRFDTLILFKQVNNILLEDWIKLYILCV